MQDNIPDHYNQCASCGCRKGEYHKTGCVIYSWGNNGPVRFNPDLNFFGPTPVIPSWPEKPQAPKPPKAPPAPQDSHTSIWKWTQDMATWAREVELWMHRHS